MTLHRPRSVSGRLRSVVHILDDLDPDLLFERDEIFLELGLPELLVVLSLGHEDSDVVLNLVTNRVQMCYLNLKSLHARTHLEALDPLGNLLKLGLDVLY